MRRHGGIAASHVRWRAVRQLMLVRGTVRNTAETKDPSGGTTGRVKLYGRLGWMGARAEYSLDGEGFPLPPILVAGAAPHVQIIGGFLILFGGTKAGSGFPK